MDRLGLPIVVKPTKGGSALGASIVHFAADLPAAVGRFQSDVELTPDGVVGARTLMALYSRASYSRPRLSGGPT